MSNQIQHKLSNFEVPPPANAWNEIEAALDSGVNHSFAEKLYSFEQPPNETIWQKIYAQLGGKNLSPARVVPFYKRYGRALKYSTAVAVFVVLAIVTSLFISKRTVSDVANINNLPEQTNSSINSQPVQNPQESKQISIDRLNTHKRGGHIRLSASKNAVWLGPEPTLRSIASAQRVVPQYAERTSAIDYASHVDKYMIYSDGDGNVVRLPKKLFDAFACPTDKVTCKQKIKKLQEQVAASAMSTDFTGILDMLNKLQENQ